MFFYGFVGVALAWQLLFFAIAMQPLRLRPVIPFAVVEKLSFGSGTIVLYNQGRLDHRDVWFGGIDLALGALFLLVWRRLAHESSPASKVTDLRGSDASNAPAVNYLPLRPAEG